eukprot:TRINITY_DN9374_c0_g1_i1.p2 TRINITY_DN9374_c0_g1~~TRINITY_DN9374_c0_g1_i1.p2  ORF type:complete len:271 (+),score=95.60 TRINITY_DN9374_c0_g1_i1:467-1279(+)
MSPKGNLCSNLKVTHTMSKVSRGIPWERLLLPLGTIEPAGFFPAEKERNFFFPCFEPSSQKFKMKIPWEQTPWWMLDKWKRKFQRENFLRTKTSHHFFEGWPGIQMVLFSLIHQVFQLEFNLNSPNFQLEIFNLKLGIYQNSGLGTDNAEMYTTYVFARNSLKDPVVHLPGTKKPTICVRFNPNRYQSRVPEDKRIFALPYRMVYAVASLDTVLIYDTEGVYPLAILEQLHYAELTDLSWSADGGLLMVSSKDGYCSFITFDELEFGAKI